MKINPEETQRSFEQALLSIDKASKAEQHSLMDIAGVGLVNISLNREVKFTPKAWEKYYMLHRENIPVLVKQDSNEFALKKVFY